MRQKNYVKCYFFSLVILCYLQPGSFAQEKEWESNVIYSETQVPFYELPDPLVTCEGKRITTVEEWEQIRRPQIMAMFAGTVYGRIPEPEQEVKQEYEVLSMDENFMDGLCTRKILLIKFSNHRGEVEMRMAVYTPNNTDGPVPLLFQLSFAGIDNRNHDASGLQQYGRLNCGVPLIYFLNKGFGFAYVYGGRIVEDRVRFGGKSIQRLYYKGNQSMPRADEWGLISATAWQASRALDYLETDEDVDASRVAILGHSRQGKCTLCAAAMDQRFSMAFMHNSGCAGAALWRRTFGETMKYMFHFPHWLCENARKYIGNEDDLPVDQHMLIACLAPRPAYVISGIDDMWADNMGEYLSTHYATPVYELYGLKGQPDPERPEVNVPANDRDLAYVVRTEGHGYFQTDWDEIVRFMDFHFNKQKKNIDIP